MARPCPKCRLPSLSSRRLGSAHIPPRYLDRGFDLYSIHHPTQEVALRRCLDFVESYPKVERGLLLAGPCGVGKTHLAVAILRTLVAEKEVSGRFVDESELLRRLQFSYGPDSPDTERDVLMPLMNMELLLWDDLGTGRPTDWVRETVGMVLNHRYTNRRITLMTTNWPLQRSNREPSSAPTLEERIGVRLYSRILEMCEIVTLAGPDARTQIHKAGHDFRKKDRKPAPPSGSLVKCPQCGSARVVRRGQTKTQSPDGPESVLGDYICGDCATEFKARTHPGSSRVEYLD